MSKADIHRLLVKMLTRSATKRELDLIHLALKDCTSQKMFKEYLQIDFIARLALEKTNIEQTKRILLQRIRKDKKKQTQTRRRRVLQVAASILALLTLTYVVKVSDNQKEITASISNLSEDITLNSQGLTRVVYPNSTLVLTDKKGNEIVEKKEDTLVYKSYGVADYTSNTLKVPYGRTMNLVLSDGSKVFLNAGSTIEFPTNFIDASHRKVTVTGEAYFEISKDESQPFFVYTDQIRVQVVGTAFNVSNYPEDTGVKVALVEGIVDLVLPETQEVVGQVVRLKPGQQGVFNSVHNALTTEEANVFRYKAWMTGRTIFTDEAFEHILIKLERKYNVIIINNNPILAKERFNATIDTNHESIEQVMEFFNKVYNIDYQIVQNKIIIK